MGARQKLDTSSSVGEGPPMTTEQEDVLDLRDAIIELYLAIKIRSTDEVSSFEHYFQVKTNKISLVSIVEPN